MRGMGPANKPAPESITQLLLSWSGGRQSALNELVPLVYPELRRLAAGYLRRERLDHTLQPTALVHEAYMRLVDQSIADCHTRARFFAIAAHVMRQILVNHAERHKAAKRGGGNKVALDEAVALAGESKVVDVLALDRALNKLAQLDPRQSHIVEMRFFCGLPEQEIAEVLDISIRTVKRDWVMAKAWLHGELMHGGAAAAKQ
jgi:RNA polymerase sigma factor (TIGR02999 family)